MKKNLLILLCLGVVIGGGWWTWQQQQQEPELQVLNTIVDDTATVVPESKITFDIDDGVRIDYASNPRIMDYTDGVLTLAYESNATALQNMPGARGYVATSTDGLSFDGNRPFNPGEQRGKGLLLPDGSLRRYFPSQDLTQFVSETSTDGGKIYTEDDGVRYVLPQEGWIGVWTEFVDADGGVVIIFNRNLKDTTMNGGEAISVSRLYAEDGLNFTMTDEEVMVPDDEKMLVLGFRDPNAVVLPDGSVRLVVMYQMPPWPPAGHTGTIYTFISEDSGRTFTFESTVAAYSDFEEFEVWSLNDPKILLLDDGRSRVYFAAMMEDQTTDDFKWVLVSATTTE